MDFVASSTQWFPKTALNGPPDPSAASSLIPGHSALLFRQMQLVFRKHMYLFRKHVYLLRKDVYLFRKHVYSLWDWIFTLKILTQLDPKMLLNCGHRFCGMELECADHCLGMSQCFTAGSAAATQVLLPGVLSFISVCYFSFCQI